MQITALNPLEFALLVIGVIVLGLMVAVIGDLYQEHKEGQL